MSGVLYVPFPVKFEYLAAGLEVYLIDELGAGLSNKSRVRKELADAVD